MTNGKKHHEWVAVFLIEHWGISNIFKLVMLVFRQRVIILESWDFRVASWIHHGVLDSRNCRICRVSLKKDRKSHRVYEKNQRLRWSFASLCRPQRGNKKSSNCSGWWLNKQIRPVGLNLCLGLHWVGNFSCLGNLFTQQIDGWGNSNQWACSSEATGHRVTTHATFNHMLMKESHLKTWMIHVWMNFYMFLYMMPTSAKLFVYLLLHHQSMSDSWLNYGRFSWS